MPKITRVEVFQVDLKPKVEWDWKAIEKRRNGPPDVISSSRAPSKATVKRKGARAPVA